MKYAIYVDRQKNQYTVRKAVRSDIFRPENLLLIVDIDAAMYTVDEHVQDAILKDGHYWLPLEVDDVHAHVQPIKEGAYIICFDTVTEKVFLTQKGIGYNCIGIKIDTDCFFAFSESMKEIMPRPIPEQTLVSDIVNAVN